MNDYIIGAAAALGFLVLLDLKFPVFDKRVSPYVIGAVVLLSGLAAFKRQRRHTFTTPPGVVIDTTEAQGVLFDLDNPPVRDPDNRDDVVDIANTLLGGALHGGPEPKLDVPTGADGVESDGLHP